LTTSNDTTARIWDAASGAPIGPPLKHANQLRDGIFLGSDRVITASADRTAHVWNLTSGREEAAFFGHAGIINSLALSGDQHWLVTASDDSTARVWDVASRETVAILSGHVKEVLSAAISTMQSPGTLPRVVSAGKDGSARVSECDVCADLPTLRKLAAERVTRELTTDERRRFLRDDTPVAP
jgi:WD40 repeat protein